MARNYVLHSRYRDAAASDGGIHAPAGQIDQRRDAVVDDRASGHHAASALALLSMGHISSPSRQLSVWVDGSRADIPSCPDPRFPNGWFPPAPSEIPKRGQVTEFSRKSRTRFVRLMSTMKQDEESYTMALTMVRHEDDDVDRLNALLLESFPKLKRRLANVEHFKNVCGFWKREFHKSGVIHYHLVLFGLADETLRADFQAWIVAQWVSLVGVGLNDEKREQLRWWHARERNMETIRTFSYFAKYVGVPEESGKLTGRWWGCFNKEKLPQAAKSATKPLPEKAVAMMQRLARRRQRNRADDAKHREICKACGFVDSSGNPRHSRFWMNHAQQRCGKRIKIPTGAKLEDLPTDRIYEYLIAKLIPATKGKRWGKTNQRLRRSTGAPMILCDKAAPAFALKALEFVSKSLGLDLSVQEIPKLTDETFMSDLLHPASLGRTLGNSEQIRSQADFLGELGEISGLAGQQFLRAQDIC